MASALVCSGAAFAADDAKAASTDASPVTRLGEVVVTGRLETLNQIQQALLDSEKRFIARYNELNKDDDYDIVCREEKPTGSHIPVRNCQAQIVDEQTEQQSNEFFRGVDTGTPTSIIPPDTLRRQAMLEVNERTLALVRSDPELMRDLLEHVQLEKLYKETAGKKTKHWWRALTGRSP